MSSTSSVVCRSAVMTPVSSTFSDIFERVNPRSQAELKTLWLAVGRGGRRGVKRKKKRTRKREGRELGQGRVDDRLY